MAADKDKGLLGTVQDQLRETTGTLKGTGPWHSVTSKIYHNNPNCQTGSNIDPKNIQQGTGGRSLCKECQRLNNAGGPVGNLTNL